MPQSHSVAWTQGHLDALASAQLPTGRGGYRTEDVDRWLRHVTALMRERQPIQRPTAGTFRRSILGQGYDVHHVDALVAAVDQWQGDLIAADQAAQRAGTHEADPDPQPVLRGDREPMKLRWTARQRDWVRETIFPARRGKWAYEMAEVDNFLDEVLTAMTKGEPLPPVESAKFMVCGATHTGYDARAVDEFLDQVIRLRPAT